MSERIPKGESKSVRPSLKGRGISFGSKQRDSDHRLVAHESLLDRFEMLAQLREGGMGSVWVARDRQLARTVAIKFLSSDLAHDPDLAARFFTEARVAAQLEHPSIVPVYAFERTEAGSPAFVMQLVEGRTLQDYLEKCVAANDSAELDRRGDNLKQRISKLLPICDAIHYAHGRGVVHRDIKPSNILLGHYNESMLTDWGVARVTPDPDVEAEVRQAIQSWVAVDSGVSALDPTYLDVNPTEPTAQSRSLGPDGLARSPVRSEPLPAYESSPSLGAGVTRSGEVVGTLEYMAPEQARDAVLVTGAADQYSLGLVALELATLRRARPKSESFLETWQIAKSAIHCELVDRWGVPVEPRLAAILRKALEPDPEARYATVGRFADDLRRFLRGEALEILPDSLARRVGRGMEAHPILAISSVLGVLLMASLVTLLSVWRAELHAERWARDLTTLTQLTSEVAQRSHVIDSRLLATQGSVESLANAAVEHVILDDPSPTELRATRADAKGRLGGWKLPSSPDNAGQPDLAATAILAPIYASDGSEHLERMLELVPLLSQSLHRTAHAGIAAPLTPSVLLLAFESGAFLRMPQAETMGDSFDARKLDWYRRARDARSPIWELLDVGHDEGNQAVGVFQPLFVGERFVGVLGAQIALERLVSDLPLPRERRMRRAMLVDITGKILANVQNPARALDPLTSRGPSDLPFGLVRALVERRSYGRIEEAGAIWLFNQLNASPWYYIAEFPADVLN